VSKADFEAAAADAVCNFERNPFVALLERGELSIAHYHRLLSALLPQVRSSSSTFALAGANLPAEHWKAKHYLFKHADEESTHWQWILGDLEATGFSGNAAAMPPIPTCAGYIGYNYFTALTFPIGRLAIASVLEGIGAAFATKYGKLAAEALGLASSQLVFFSSHGETDVGHSQEIARLLDESNLGAKEWSQLAVVAKTAGRLYTAIYDEASTL
jgi:hypothetical protein